MIARGAQPAQPQDQSVWWDSLLYNQSNKLHLRKISTFSMIFKCFNCKKERNIFRKEHSALYYHLPISFQLAEDILRWAGLAFSTKTEKVFRNPHYYHRFLMSATLENPAHHSFCFWPHGIEQTLFERHIVFYLSHFMIVLQYCNSVWI